MTRTPRTSPGTAPTRGRGDGSCRSGRAAEGHRRLACIFLACLAWKESREGEPRATGDKRTRGDAGREHIRVDKSFNDLRALASAGGPGAPDWSRRRRAEFPELKSRR